MTNEFDPPHALRIALEGVHGSGKTTILNHFKEAGFATLDEGFLDMPVVPSLHPQTLTMESNWVNCWFQRLLRKISESDDDQQVLITDRSPFSAVFYTRNGMGKLLEPLIRAQIEELKSLGIEIYTVYLKVDAEVLWGRIRSRLESEPERLALKEHRREWMEEVKSFYDGFAWDLVCDNNDREQALTELMVGLMDQVSQRSPKFRDAVRGKRLAVVCGSPLIVPSACAQVLLP